MKTSIQEVVKCEVIGGSCDNKLYLKKVLNVLFKTRHLLVNLLHSPTNYGLTHVVEIL